MKFTEIQAHLALQIRGKDSLLELSVATFLAGGHLLLEGPPGTGKTSLARGMARVFGGSFRRIQMTSDLLPSDIVGFLRLKPGSSEFEFRAGPIFSNFLLADELNRSSPKTQSALLEAMAEGTVSVDGTTHRLPEPFFVMATQNPMEFHGVFPLAESQLDRFMLQLPFDFPEKDDELAIYRQPTPDHRPGHQPGHGPAHGKAEISILTTEEIRKARSDVADIFVEESVLDYCARLVRGTRGLPEVAYGVSVRGGLQLIASAKALAYLRGRNFVEPGDVRSVAVPALAHRICYHDGNYDSNRKREAVKELVEKIPAPR